ncbi:MAG: Smr/MutS family protein [Dehalococcoidales bacterium]|nr:Smr/MutS family protein [Dehalococcoidales bacterium]
MDEKSLELLEFPRIREQIAGYASFSPGRELALKLRPLTDYAQISHLLALSAEARLLLSIEPGFSIGDVHDIRETVRLAGLGKILETESLLEIQFTLAALIYLHSRLDRRQTELPLLWKIGEGIIELPDLEKQIGRCFNPDGQIKDEASPKLAKIRRQLRSVRSELLASLQSIINSENLQKSIQEPIITEREGRYVIPVKAEYRREFRGIVHDVSNTGATVFVEPWSAIEPGNEIRELEVQEKYEIELILRELSNQVGLHAAEISRSITLVAEIDLALAKARYARRLNAAEPQMIPPEDQNQTSPPQILRRTQDSGVSDDSRMTIGDGKQQMVLKLVDARHPLLVDKAVPLSVEIGKDYSILVITGPNTGGKTVALKTVGLLSLMAQSGLPIPAAPESCLPVFDNIFADIGDEQSIAQTLSTFSWHISNIVRIINQVTDRSIVLLDELGTSTDPAEGSALARSLLLYLKNRGAMAVATTHFSELKAFAHTTPGLQNASLDFDPVTLAPTYHVSIGIPGGSNAMATASRLGLPAEIVEEAKSMLNRSSIELETLLTDLSAEKTTVESLKKDVEKEKAELVRHNQELENERQKLRSEEKQILQEVRDNVVQESAELHREIRQALAELRKSRSKDKAEEARRVLADVQEKLKSGKLAPQPLSESGEEVKIGAGDTVWLKDASMAATVLYVSEDGQQVELQVGRAKLKVSADNVQKMEKSAGPLPEMVTITRSVAKKNVTVELDLRGKRAEEIESLVDVYLNDAAVSNMKSVRIIHGHGTGVVKQIVREMLATHPLAKSSRPGGRGEGGDGVTVVSL